MFERRDFLFAEGGADRDRAVAGGVQHEAATLLRDECLNGEIFYSLREAQIVIEQWRAEYNTRRPHSRPATDRRRRQRSRRKWRLSGLLRPPARRQLHPCRRRL